jgi:hypothetical protein
MPALVRREKMMGNVVPTKATVMPVILPTKNGSATITKVMGTREEVNPWLISETAWLSSRIPLKTMTPAITNIMDSKERFQHICCISFKPVRFARHTQLMPMTRDAMSGISCLTVLKIGHALTAR